MNWKKYLIPLLVTIVLSLIGVIYYSLADDVKTNKVEIKKVCTDVDKKLEKKVDNKTLQMTIQLLQTQQKAVEKNLDRLYKEVKDIKK